MKADKNLPMKKDKEKKNQWDCYEGFHLVILSDVKSFMDGNTWV